MDAEVFQRLGMDTTPIEPGKEDEGQQPETEQQPQAPEQQPDNGQGTSPKDEGQQSQQQEEGEHKGGPSAENAARRYKEERDREKAEKLFWQQQALMYQQAQAAQQKSQPEQKKPDELEIPDDDFVTGAQAKKMAEQNRLLRQEIELTRRDTEEVKRAIAEQNLAKIQLAEAAFKETHPDYEVVVTHQTMTLLAPDDLQAVRFAANPAEKAYTLIKQKAASIFGAPVATAASQQQQEQPKVQAQPSLARVPSAGGGGTGKPNIDAMTTEEYAKLPWEQRKKLLGYT